MKNFSNKQKNEIFFKIRYSMTYNICCFGIKSLLIIVCFSIRFIFKENKTDSETYTSFENGHKFTYLKKN
jgi:hypothetical protein